MKLAVLKLSGKTLNQFLSTSIWTDTVKKLNEEFDGVVIVHGAGKNISEWSELLGHQTKFIEGQRVTTPELMEVVAAVQAGLVNTQIVAKLNSNGIESSGFSGIDRNTFVADYIDKNLGFVGKPVLTGKVDWIKEIISNNVTPVFSSVCRDVNGNLMNVNADIFTEVLALSLKSDTVFFVSDIDGVMIEGNVQNFLNEDAIEDGIKEGHITDGMIPKLRSSVALLHEGINKIWIGSKLIKDTGKKTDNIYANGTWITSTKEDEIRILSVA